MQERLLFSGIDGIEVLEQEPLSSHISFRLGGCAKRFIKAPGRALPELLRRLSIEGGPFVILGNGTNLLVRDEGYPGTVVKIISETPSVLGCEITASAGTSLSSLANTALSCGLAGLEFAHGIPGTVGGGVCMNAGAYGGSLSDRLVKTEYCDREGTGFTLMHAEHDFGYRHSFFTDNPQMTVLKSTFKLEPSDPVLIEGKMREFAEKRRASQPLSLPSAGSVFKRPEGHFAGKLIEDCGLKGYTIGGAQVSPKHAGFIVNVGGATFSDVSSLIKHIQKTVFERFNVMLETEVKILGEESF